MCFAPFRLVKDHTKTCKLVFLALKHFSKVLNIFTGLQYSIILLTIFSPPFPPALQIDAHTVVPQKDPSADVKY